MNLILFFNSFVTLNTFGWVLQPRLFHYSDMTSAYAVRLDCVISLLQCSQYDFARNFQITKKMFGWQFINRYPYKQLTWSIYHIETVFSKLYFHPGLCQHIIIIIITLSLLYIIWFRLNQLFYSILFYSIYVYFICCPRGYDTWSCN